MRYQLLLLAVLAMFISPSLHARRVMFDRWKFAVTVPDSGWVWDTSAIIRGNEVSRLVLRVSDEMDLRRLTILMLDDSGGAAAVGDALAYDFFDMLIREQHCLPRDTSFISVGGVGAVRLTGEMPTEEMDYHSFSMVIVCANEHGYAIFTGLDDGRPEYDPVLQGIIQSFTFIGEPTHVHHEPVLSGKPVHVAPSSPLTYIMGVAVIGMAIGIPTVIIILLVRRSKRRRDEEAEREWGKL